MTAAVNTNAQTTAVEPATSPTLAPMELSQLADTVVKLSATNRKLVWELEKVSAEARSDRKERDRMRADNERLNAENANLSRKLLEVSEQLSVAREIAAEANRDQARAELAQEEAGKPPMCPECGGDPTDHDDECTRGQAYPS